MIGQANHLVGELRHQERDDIQVHILHIGGIGRRAMKNAKLWIQWENRVARTVNIFDGPSSSTEKNRFPLFRNMFLQGRIV